MKVLGERHRLTEIAGNLEQQGLGSVEATLLTRLQEGNLQAHIRFPSFARREVIIPTVTWEDIELEDFRVAPYNSVTRIRRNEAQATDFKIDATFAFDEEIESIKKLAIAAVKSSSELVPEIYRSTLEGLGLIGHDADVSDWAAVASLCVKWTEKLGELPFDQIVYVTSNEYRQFEQRFVQKEPGKAKPGIERTPLYEQMWRRAFQIAFGKLNNPSSDEKYSRSDLVRDLEIWFEKQPDDPKAKKVGSSSIRKKIDEAFIELNSSNFN